jgi:hypothetical protein
MTVTQAYVRGSRYFRDDLGKIILSTVLIGLTTLAELLQPFPFQIMLDRVLGDEHPSGWLPRHIYAFWRSMAPSTKLQQVIVLAATVLVLRFLQESLGLLNGILKIRIGYNGLLHVRTCFASSKNSVSASTARAPRETQYTASAATPTRFRRPSTSYKRSSSISSKSSRSAF